MLLGAVSGLGAAEEEIRGSLALAPDGSPAVKLADGRLVRLEGDKDTVGVIADERLRGTDFEAVGEFLEPGLFRIGPIHKKSMWIHRNGRRHSISYWCEVCSIRSYTPGICWCCQEETELDLREAGDQ